MKLKLKKTQQKPNSMRSKIHSLLSKKQFFKIINSTNNSITYTLEKPSRILISNIYINWLRYLHWKTHKVMPIYVQNTKDILNKHTSSLPFGVIENKELEYKGKTLEFSFDDKKEADLLQFKLLIPEQDFMQYFIQWQRYRKFWWSSITTTPNLFSIGDIKQGENEAEADIVANSSCGKQSVEQIWIINHDQDIQNAASLTCTMSLEKALFILLMDGINDDPKEEYLKLHSKIAPYKMSFSLNVKDPKNSQSLKDLAALLFHRLNLEKVVAFLPDFSTSIEEQVSINLKLGIPYTAVLDESTLHDGILYLLNSSTMLKEQVHIADFHKYAALICSTK